MYFVTFSIGAAGPGEKKKWTKTIYFSLMNALVYVDIDQGIHQGKK